MAQTVLAFGPRQHVRLGCSALAFFNHPPSQQMDDSRKGSEDICMAPACSPLQILQESKWWYLPMPHLEFRETVSSFVRYKKVL
jgi:hypothetical protein